MTGNVIIHSGVSMGANPNIEDFSIIGKPINGTEPARPTSVGDNALIRSHTVIYAGNIIGNNFQTGHGVMIREENRIGDQVSIGTSSVVEHHVHIANRVRLHSNVFIPEFSTLEEGCWLGPNVVLTNAKYPLSQDAKNNLQGPVIGRGAKIGANTTILPGVVIGENALVGAGSVVTRDVPPNTVVAGNPAVFLGRTETLPYPSTS